MDSGARAFTPQLLCRLFNPGWRHSLPVRFHRRSSDSRSILLCRVLPSRRCQSAPGTTIGTPMASCRRGCTLAQFIQENPIRFDQRQAILLLGSWVVSLAELLCFYLAVKIRRPIGKRAQNTPDCIECRLASGHRGRGCDIGRYLQDIFRCFPAYFSHHR